MTVAMQWRCGMLLPTLPRVQARSTMLKTYYYFLFQVYLFTKFKKFLQGIIDVIIEIINKNINDVTFKNFAKTLIKFNVQLQTLQFL